MTLTRHLLMRASLNCKYEFRKNGQVDRSLEEKSPGFVYSLAVSLLKTVRIARWSEALNQFFGSRMNDDLKST